MFFLLAHAITYFLPFSRRTVGLLKLVPWIEINRTKSYFVGKHNADFGLNAEGKGIPYTVFRRNMPNISESVYLACSLTVIISPIPMRWHCPCLLNISWGSLRLRTRQSINPRKEKKIEFRSKNLMGRIGTLACCIKRIILSCQLRSLIRRLRNLKSEIAPEGKKPTAWPHLIKFSVSRIL